MFSVKVHSITGLHKGYNNDSKLQRLNQSYQDKI